MFLRKFYFGKILFLRKSSQPIQLQDFFKSTISPETIDENPHFLQIFFWLGIVKNGCQQSGLWTLKLTVSQGRADGINWFFLHTGTNSGKQKVDLMIFGGHGKKWLWLVSLWDSKICCILKMNLWIELIFWMLIVIQ